MIFVVSDINLKVFISAGENVHNLQEYRIFPSIDFHNFEPNLHFAGMKICDEKNQKKFNHAKMSLQLFNVIIACQQMLHSLD